MNKIVYFIGGLSGTGKTTLANELSEKLTIPNKMCDVIYGIVQKRIGLNRKDIWKLMFREHWENPIDTQLKELGIYETMDKCFKVSYLEWFDYLLPQQIILEGFGLFNNPLELQVLQDIFKEHEKRYLMIYPDYEQWIRNRTNKSNDIKMNRDRLLPSFKDEVDYYEDCNKYLSKMPKETIVIKSLDQLQATATGGITYQNDDVINKKWLALGLTDLKDKKVFELSCNAGGYLSKAYEQGAKCYGLDIAWELLNETLNKISNAQLYLSKIEDFNFPEHYDYIISISSFHYYKHREKVIEKISNACDCFLLECPVSNDDKENLIYYGGENIVPSKLLLEKWLKKYFKKVTIIGQTENIDNEPRNIWRCEK
jgi:hypothetical protein